MEGKRQDSGHAALLAVARRHLLGNYQPAPVVMDHGRGCELFDTEGRRYLDFCAGVAVCSLGHAHPELARAIGVQAEKALQISNYFYNRENVELARELCEATGFDRAFFCNSGAEANEALLKLARRWHFGRGDKSRVRVIAFHDAFHGRTLGALAMTGTPAYREGFGEPLAGVEHVAYGDLEAVEARMGNDVAAVMVEPLQGEGGVMLPPAGFLAGLRQKCDAHGALLIIDEIQAGMGRTGTLLGSEHSGVRADAISLAKGLAGGVPIGAMLLRERLSDALPPGSHGSTFGGNPLASAAARVVLATIRQATFLDDVRRRGDRLGAGLRAVASKHPALCTGERGLGLLRAITLTGKAPARDLLPAAREHGLLLTAAGARALRFTPPLIVSDPEIDEALEMTDAALGAVERSLQG